MRHRSPRRVEDPTWRAELTVIMRPLPPLDQAENELPTRRAALTVISQSAPPLDLAENEQPTWRAALTIVMRPLPGDPARSSEPEASV